MTRRFLFALIRADSSLQPSVCRDAVISGMSNLLPVQPVSPVTSPEAKKQLFFTIILTDKFLQAAFVEMTAQGAEMKEISKVRSYFDRKDLLEQLDQSLQELGPESEDVTETIFAFDSEWLKDNDLTDEKKVVVKQLSEELSLEAIGQLNTAEMLAEARLVADENDSCFLLYLKPESFELIFLKHGQLLDVIQVGRSAHFSGDFTESLARAAADLHQEGEYFPDKIILTSLAVPEKDLRTMQAELQKFPWQKNPGFLQTPSVAVMEEEYVMKSLVMTAGRVLTKQTLRSKRPVAAGTDSVGTTQSISTPIPVTSKQEEHTLSPTNPDKEIAVELPQASSFGIPFSKQYFESRAIDPTPFKETSVNPEELAKIGKKRSPWQRFVLQHKKILAIGIGCGLLSLFLLFFVFALFFSQVEVVVKPHRVLLQKTATITLDPKIAASDVSNLQLKAEVEQKEVEGEDVTKTSGVSLVGEKAKGKVTIFNKTTQVKDLAAGSELAADNNIKFSLDEATNVPAATEKTEGVDFGKKDVAVTATAIGAESNLKKNAKLRVANFAEDQFAATATEDFSGGSSREVKVVAETDQSKVLQQLSKNLFEIAKKELDEASNNGTHYVATGQTKVLSTTYSAKVGDEAENVTLHLKLGVESIKYSSSDLKDLAFAVLQQDLPSQYAFANEEPSLMSDEATASGKAANLQMTVELSNSAVAQLQTADIQKSIAGLDFATAQQKLADNDLIETAELRYQPPFLNSLLKKIPNNAQRIQVLIKP